MGKQARKKVYKVEVLGEETIHPLQQRLAEKTLTLLLKNEDPKESNKRSPVIILPPQGGKTGAIMWLIHRFIEDCVARRRTFQVVVFCGLSQLALTSQTKGQLKHNIINGDTPRGAYLHAMASLSRLTRYPAHLQDQGILILHNSQKLKRLDLNVPVDVRLWIGDEVHLGNGEGGNIATMLANHGVKINEQPGAWDKKWTVDHFVGVSATPLAHMIMSDNMPSLVGDALFRWVYEPLPPNYNGFETMWQCGRLRQTEPMFLPSGAPTEFLFRVCDEFKTACDTYGPGYLVIRATGKKHRRLLDHLSKRGRRVEIRQYDCSEKNLDELTACLATPASEPTIVLIRAGMRAGITLGDGSHIRGWVETESSTSDSQAQAGIGRACGYDRIGEVYPIYCDLDHVRHWIAVYNDLDREVAPRHLGAGIQNKSLKPRIPYNVKEVLSRDKAWNTYVKPYRNADKQKDGRGGSERYRKQFSSTSGNVVLDVAALFLEGRRDSGSTMGIHVDGPTSKEAVDRFIANNLPRPGTTVSDVHRWARRNRASYAKLLKVLAERYPNEDFTVTKSEGRVKRKGKVLVWDVEESLGGSRRRTTGEKMIVDGQTRNEFQKKRSALRSEK
jgi:hypothetical protein